MKAFADAGFKLGKNAFQQTAQWTRLYRLDRKLPRDENENSMVQDPDQLRAIVAAMWQSFSETEQKIRAVLASFSWNLAG